MVTLIEYGQVIYGDDANSEAIAAPEKQESTTQPDM
jgi:hypothetical protein